MTPIAPAVRRPPLACAVLALAVGLVLSPLARSADALPPRASWTATSSASTTVEMAPPKGIDGDPATKWGGAFSPGHWYQVDLGKRVAVGAVELHWEWGGARAYSIQASDDGEHWRTAFETRDGVGGIEYDVFPTVQARYLRLTAPDRSADWGVSVFEFQPYAGTEAPRIRGVDGDPAALWSDAGEAHAMTGKPAADGMRQLQIDLPTPVSVAGLEVAWKDTPRAARLEGREAGSDRWIVLAEDPRAFGDSAFLADSQARTLSALRLSVRGQGTQAPRLQRLRLIGPKRVMTAMKRYELAASREHRALFPSSLHQQQVYWTAVGIPAGRQKSVLDEFGHVEAFKGAPLVQPVWRDASGRASAANADTPITHALRDGWMPMPTVQWSPQPGLELTTAAIALEQRGAPVTLVRYRLRNTGTAPVAGSFNLLTRPMQVSPPWQNGGPSPIRDIRVGSGDAAQVAVNGRTLFQSLTPVARASASAFGAHGEGEITGLLMTDALPDAQQAHDDTGLAAGQLGYDVALAPGATQDIVIAFALGDARIDPAKPLPAAPALDLAGLTGGGAFDARAGEVAAQWEKRLGRIGLSLPDASLVDMLRAQAAYMLINQSGHAMQPGPRNYNRSFIRDGAATAATLVRMGMPKTARDYLQWYAGHAVHENGLVSPILNDDGSVNTGFGSDIEYDSQGQFIWLVAELARLDGGARSVRDYQDKVTRAMTFMQELRERTMVPGYLADQSSPERFHGILAPSISHEGYPVPTHSYWDDYWALKGWHDGAWLAEQWGDAKTAAWAREQYAALRESMAASLRATMKWKGVDYVPADADMGGSDPTSLSIGLDPAGQQDVMPADALKTTFDRYLDDVRKRDTPGALFAYTPYEIRNVLTYVHLNRPQEAQELLMRFLGHRRPGPWQVLAEVVYSDPRHAIYLGDMPHTWIGSEYARALFGMLMHEGDDALSLLPGTPPAWVAGDGLRVDGLPTAYGTLAMTARQQGQALRVTLGPGLRKDTALKVSWPNRTKPSRVTVDGKAVPAADYDADGLRLAKPFRTLDAAW